MLSGTPPLETDPPRSDHSPSFRLVLLVCQLCAVAAAAFPQGLGLPLLATIAVADAVAARVPAIRLLKCLTPLVGFAVLGLALLVAVPPTGEVSVEVIVWAGLSLPVQGALFIASVIARSAVIVLLAATAVHRLGERDLLDGLTGLGLPPILVGLPYLMVRSLHSVGDAVLQLTRSRDARGRPRGLRAVTVAAAMSQALIIRTGRRAEATGLAMAARGFAGRLPLVRYRRISPGEMWLLGAWGVALAWLVSLR